MTELILTEAMARAYDRDARSYLSWRSAALARTASLKREVTALWGGA